MAHIDETYQSHFCPDDFPDVPACLAGALQAPYTMKNKFFMISEHGRPLKTSLCSDLSGTCWRFPVFCAQPLPDLVFTAYEAC